MTVEELKTFIYENNKVPMILEDLGCHHIAYHDLRDYYSAAQPDGDNPMGVNIKNNCHLNYRSFSRSVDYNDGEDLITLVEKIKKVSFIDAIKYLHRLLGLDYKYQKPVKKNNQTQANQEKFRLSRFKQTAKPFDVNDIVVIDEDVLNDYISIPYIGWLREGVMPWTIRKYGIAYSYRRKRVIIPMRYWLTGELLGINSRTIVPNYKELGIKKFFITPTYPKNANLFGLYENYDEIKKAGYVVIYESEKSVLKRDSKLDYTGVALSGHTLSSEQVRILLGLNVDIVISMDNDIPVDDVRFLCEKFYKNKKARVYYTHDQWGLLGENDSIADMPNKVFDFLMKYKVLYDESEHKKFEESMKK